ncbi:MAG: plastocyanin/azurin family copper-binding protein, partial [Bacteroidetes bacterium]|nr:plastocyanin/azurin family copper-binding protein [Bacteroidota bacterium]
MKTKILLFLSLLLINLSSYSTVWTVSNSGTTFTPATITINLGDTVVFTLDPSHDVLEVSQSTWNADGNTALSGGFSVAYGGGTLLPAQLTVGTHYYVCEPHASMGMKGIIIVQSCTAPTQPLTISGNAAICSGTSNTYSITAVSGATSYTWTLPSGWTGTSTNISITATASITAGNVSVTANNACGSSAAKTLAVTVNTPPAQPGAITGNISICSGTSNTYSVAAVSGATSYTWTLASGWSGSSTTSTITTVAGATGGTVSVTANNSCGSSAVKTVAVTVNAIPAQPLAVTGSAGICSGSSNIYSVAAVSGATSYTWTLPSGWSGSSATSTITAVANASGGTVSVTANNSCGSSAVKTLAVSINPIPAQPGAISGSASICSGTSNSYSIAAVSGATSYTWSLPSGWSGSSATSTITTVAGATGGTVSVTANNSCGSSAGNTIVVTVNTPPAQAAAITGNVSICSATTNTYSIAAVSGATSYTWTLPSGWSGSSATSTITTVASATGGTISVTANNSCGSSAVKTLAVTVNAIPAQPAAISGSAGICSGSSNTYSVAAVSGATSYTWSL